MALTHKVTTSYTAEDGQIVSNTVSYTGDGAGAFDGTIAKGVGTPNQDEIDLAIADVTKIKSLCFYSDKAVTLFTNAVDGTGGDTIALGAGRALVWAYDDPDSATCPLTENVTKIYITNSSLSVDANVKLRWLIDSTP